MSTRRSARITAKKALAVHQPDVRSGASSNDEDDGSEPSESEDEYHEESEHVELSEEGATSYISNAML